MSVTVKESLKLPSLRHAKVVAGKNGLKKIVSGISVLESADPGALINELFQDGDYLANELVITAFVNCKDDPDLQCKIIRRLAEGGEVGLILFYVGIYLPKIDQKCIDLANELDFPLIQMPGNIALRYGEVISDVSDCLYHDKTQQVSIAADVLARIAALSEHQQTVNTVLKMLSRRLQASVVLTNSNMDILNLAAWPTGMEDMISRHKDIFSRMNDREVMRYPHVPDGHIYHTMIFPNIGPPLNLFMVKEGGTLSYKQQEQASDLVRIGINIWGKQHSAVVLSELIRAIIQDDPIKMRRLADIFHINIAEVHNMWIFSGRSSHTLQILNRYQDMIRDVMQSCADNVFFDFYEEKLFLFSSTPFSVRELDSRLVELLGKIREEDQSITLFSSGGLQTTTDVRQAYLAHMDHLKDAAVIYPEKHWFTYGEITFSEKCHALIEQGEDSVRQALKPLTLLQQRNLDWDVVHTLSVYLLDTEGSVTASANLLHVHQNTIKYRLTVIGNYLGFHPGKIPDNVPLYQSLAIRRLLKE